MTLYEVENLSQSTISYEQVYIQKSSRPVANDQLNEIIAEILVEIIQSSNNMNQVEANNSIFTAKKMPTISLKDYLNRIAKLSCCSQESFIVALIFLDRLMSFNKGFHLSKGNVHRVIFIAIITAIKYIDDKFYKNDYYAKVGGVSLAEMNNMEKSFVFQLNFKFYVESEMFFKYREQLLSSKSQ